MTELQEQAATAANRHIIERPRLTRLLDETTARAIMLVAPAGYGKTTLAAEWIRRRPHAWLRLTAASSDVAALAASVATAASTVCPSGDIAVIKRLSASSNPIEELDALAELQTRDLSGWPADGWLVLDEYEWLCTSAASEEYIRLVFERSPINLLITSRSKPGWATARARVYGRFFLIDRPLLEMTNHEARCVLSQLDPDTTDSLLESAAGWPAVLGLAASGRMGRPPEPLPDMLYEFLADELFYRSTPALQRALPRLALAPRVSAEVATVVCGESATAILEEASAAGYFTDASDQSVLHPLLQSFLLKKLDPAQREARRVGRKLTDLFLERHAWDDAFHVIQTVPDSEALIRLISCGHEALLRSGRTMTLSEWIRAARDLGTQDALIDVVDAELSAREGSVARAERTALYAARQADSTIRFRALCIAGRAAHLDNRETAALRHFRDAEMSARNDRERREACWGALACASGLADTVELQRALEAFLEYEPQCPEDVLRAANAVLFSSPILGGLEQAVDDALAVVELARDSDPVIAASYLHTLARTLTVIGRYEEAVPIADDAIALSESAGLDFALPHGHVARAVALLGLGDYVSAEGALATAQDVSSKINDRHNLADVRAVRARVAISQRETAIALTLSDESPRGVTAAMRAEYTAIRALAFACAGRVLEADTALSELTNLSSLSDANGLALATRAVIAAVRRDRSALQDELVSIQSIGIIDPLVVAYRGSPELSAITDLDIPDLQRAVTRAKLDVKDCAVGSLTAREREVLSLLKRGQTNKEIAAQLFITEATAKLHVRHILRKLGVRSRTEAAILAMKLAPEVAPETREDRGED